jgi:AhpD family alkylhydroperoxidase
MFNKSARRTVSTNRGTAQMEVKMNAFSFPTVETAHPDARPLLEGPQKHLGFVPNLLLGLSNSPATLASYADLSKHFARVGLTGIEMQAVLVVASVENACAYCVAAHSTFATNLKIEPTVLNALRQGAEPQAQANPNVNLDIGGLVQVSAWQSDGRALVHYRGAQWSALLRPGALPEPGEHRVVEMLGSRLVLEKT